MANCPICNSTKTNEILNWDPYKINKCQGCQLVFASPLPADQVLMEYYQGFLFNKPADFEIKKAVENRKIELKRLFKLDESSKGKLFLDHGAGTGAAFKASMDLGLDSFYQDLDEQAIQFSRDTFGLTDEKFIADITKATTRFDYILSDNVIEHVKDPLKFTSDLIDKLSENGTLVIKTPHASNTETFFNPFISLLGYFRKALKRNSFGKTVRAYFKRFWHCDPPRHLYSFSKESFEVLMKSFNGFTYEISYYQVPWFKNTLTEQFFSRDKNFSLLKSIVIRMVLFPIIPIEVFVHLVGKLLLALKVATPAGIILTITKK